MEQQIAEVEKTAAIKAAVLDHITFMLTGLENEESVTLHRGALLDTEEPLTLGEAMDILGYN